MELVFLGTGTSTGVPMIGCKCRTCRSTDPCDRRLRSSVLVRPFESGPGILIDAGPDLRAQLLAQNTPDIAALLVTHIHYDHVGGIDDLRPYCYAAPGGKFPIYCRADVGKGIMRSVPYAFAQDHYPGAPAFELHTVDDNNSFVVCISGGKTVEVIPLPVLHAQMPILGYRIGALAYITDCSQMPAGTLERLRGVDTLVINALRPEPHMSHLSLQQSLDIVAELNPRQAYLTHMSHDMPPAAEVQPALPSNVRLANDGARIIIPASSFSSDEGN